MDEQFSTVILLRQNFKQQLYQFHSLQQSTVPPATPTAVTVQDLVELLTAAKKDPLPEWKLEHYNGHPLPWHEWIGQFKNAIDSAPLSIDMKRACLKTLVTGKAKTAIALAPRQRNAAQCIKKRLGLSSVNLTSHTLL